MTKITLLCSHHFDGYICCYSSSNAFVKACMFHQGRSQDFCVGKTCYISRTWARLYNLMICIVFQCNSIFFFKLQCTPASHPMALSLAMITLVEFIEIVELIVYERNINQLIGYHLPLVRKLFIIKEFDGQYDVKHSNSLVTCSETIYN